MDEIECRLQIDIDDHIPLLLLHLQHQSVPRDTRIVYENIYTAEIAHYLLDDLVRLLEIGGVGGIGLAAHPERKYLLLRLPAVLIYGQVGKGYIRTVLGKAKGNGLANAAGRTRYHGHFSFK